MRVILICHEISCLFILGALAALILILFGIAVFIVLRNQRKKQEEEIYDSYEKHRMAQEQDEFNKVIIF